MNEQFSEIRDHFLAALERDGLDAQLQYAAEHCAGNPKLRRELEDMVRAHHQSEGFLASKAAATQVLTSVVERPGVTIGPYKLMEQIGEGGMGLVFVAEQHEPVRRKVALKVIKPGMDTRDCLARFEAERQALALMDHPNIARVLDAGATTSGRPYFVMELVKGVPITQYCDENRLAPRERLSLFVHVCHAVQHAHQKGIIHRDIKPSNVLVASHDGTPVVKVIDFGVAKAIGQQLTERTIYTAMSQMVGTPLYMSPEQAGMSSLDIDTRTDIYSLGVLLYELLTGTTPFDKDRLKQAAYDEMRRIIREEEPEKPSTRISSTDGAPSIAACRHMDPDKLVKLVRGDLDWIVMKALEKDRSRRYETANGFAADVLHYLADEPVLACPPSATYRFRKFTRRNKAALATAAMVAVALVVGIAVSTWQAIRATKAETLAQTRLQEETKAHNEAERTRKEAELARDGEAKQRQLAEEQKTLAEKNAAEAETQRRQAEANFAQARKAVDDYFIEVSESELLKVPGMQPLRQELLRSALAFYQDFVALRGDDPRLKEELAQTSVKIGRIQRELEAHADANKAYDQALKLFRELLKDDPDRLQLKAGEITCLNSLGKYAEAIEGWESLLLLDPENNEYRNDLAQAYNTLAVRESEARKYSESLAWHQKARDLRMILVAQEPKNAIYLNALGQTLNNIGVIISRQGRSEDALAMYREAAGYAETARAQNPASLEYGKALATFVRNTALIEHQLGRADKALESYQQHAEICRTLATRNPAVPSLQKKMLDAFHELARVQREQDRQQDAARSLRQARELIDRLPRELAGDWYLLAQVKALCAGSPDASGAPEDPRDVEQRRLDADEAVAALKTAVEKGFSDHALFKREEAQFATIAQREDFRQVVAGIEQLARIAEIDKQKTDAAKLSVASDIADALAKLSAADPQNALLLASYARSRYAMGLARMGLGQHEEAEKSLKEALEIRQQISQRNPTALAAALELIDTQVALTELYEKTERYAQSHQIRQELLNALTQRAKSHRGDSAIASQIVNRQLKVVQAYGKLGLWPLAAQREFVDLLAGDLQHHQWAARLSQVLASEADEKAWREVCARYDEALRAKATPSASEQVHLAWCAAIISPPAIESQRLVALAEPALKESATNPWYGYCLGLAQHRAGQQREALATLESFPAFRDSVLQPGIVGINAAYLAALAAKADSQAERATKTFQRAEKLYRDICNQCLLGPQPGLASGCSDVFWELAAAQLLRREAWQVFHSAPMMEDAWQRLIQARAWRLIDDKTRSDAELAASMNVPGNDPELWIARARLLERWDDTKQLAELNWRKAVELAGDNPSPWIQRGRWYAERGEHAKADADFKQAASLTSHELNKFLEAGWWVVGPYPRDPKEFCPPELDPDPSRPVYAVDPTKGLSDQPVKWQSVATGNRGHVNLKTMFAADNISTYSLAYVYSPEERTATLLVGADDGFRVWVNGELVHEGGGLVPYKLNRVPVKLRAGRNTLLVKVAQYYGNYAIMLRLADGPIDRAVELAELGLWEEASKLVAEQEVNALHDSWLSARWASLLLAAGDVDAWRRQSEWMLDEFGKSADPAALLHAAWSCTLAPDITDDAARLVQLAEKGQVPDVNQRHRIGILARALYRAGRFDDAIVRVKEIDDLQNHTNDLVLAMSYHRLGQAAQARKALAKAQSWYDLATQEALSGKFLKRPHSSWYDFADFQIFYREAKALIEGTRTVDDPNAVALLAAAGQQLDHRDGRLADFDQAVTVEPDRPRHWLARARRLVELARFDEAEADFTQAVQRDPKNPDLLTARAVFYAERAESAKAAADFDRSLNLVPEAELWSQGQPTYLKISQYDDVFEQLVALRSTDMIPWTNRMILRLRQGQRDAALADARYLTTSYVNHEAVEAVLLCQDRKEFQRLRASMTQASDPVVRAIVLGLAPTQEPMTADLMATAKQLLDEGPKDTWRRRNLGVAQLRAGQYREAIQTEEDLLNPSYWWLDNTVTWALLAIAHHHLGEQEQARQRLKQTEIALELLEQAADAGRFETICVPHGIVAQEWLRAVIYYQEAKDLIDGPEAGQEVRDRFAARAAARNKDQGTKAEARRQNALARVEEAWQRKVDTAGKDPLPWIERGRWHAERGEREKADADFAKAASLTPNELNKFLAAGWWVAGPYPPSLKEFCPPELNPDPSKGVLVVHSEKGLSDQPAGWKTLATGPAGEFDARSILAGSDKSIYALAYVFSPNERTALLRVAGAKGIRLWVNGRLAFETDQQLGWTIETERVPIVLREGRNELLMKTLNTPLAFRLGDSPVDRTWMFAERRLWDEAATDFQNSPGYSSQASSNVWEQFIRVALLTGHEPFYREQCVQIFERFRLSGDIWSMHHAAHASSFAPNPVLQEHHDDVVRMAMAPVNQRSDNFNVGITGQSILTAVRASLLTGRLAEAQRYLADLPDVGYIQQMALACRAILAEKKGDHDEAVNWLEKSHANVLQHCSAKRFPNWPITVTHLLQLREAERVVTGATTRSDELIGEVRARAVADWKAADPLTLAFDHRILVHNVTRQRASEGDALVACGRRLLELQRWEEAEFDFNQAIKLAPKDPNLVAELARLHVSRGARETAAANFHRALNLIPEKDRSSLGEAIYLEIAANDDIFQRVAELRSADRNLWISRMIHHVRQGARQEALADASRLLAERIDYAPLATVLLLGEKAEFERLRAKASEPLALGLAPTDEPLSADLLETARRGWDQTKSDASGRRALGLAQLRSRQWRAALATLQPSLDFSNSWQHSAANWALLAIAHHHLGETQQARKRLEQAALWLELHEQARAAGNYGTISTPEHGLFAQDWLLATVFFQEAKALIMK